MAESGSDSNKPVTEGRLIYLFNDMKDFVRSTVKGSETVLRKEFKADIQILQIAATEHSKQIKNLDAQIKDLGVKIDGVEHRLDAKIDGVEQRLDAKIDGVRTELKEEIRGVETRLSEKIDRVGDKVENHEVRIASLETSPA